MNIPKHVKKTVTRHEFIIGEEDRPTDARTFTDGIGWVQRKLAEMGIRNSDDMYYVRAGEGGQVIIFLETTKKEKSD